VMRQLKDHMPIERAKMKLKVTAPARDTKKVTEKMKQLNCQIEEESHDPDLILVSSSTVSIQGNSILYLLYTGSTG